MNNVIYIHIYMDPMWLGRRQLVISHFYWVSILKAKSPLTSATHLHRRLFNRRLFKALDWHIPA